MKLVYTFFVILSLVHASYARTNLTQSAIVLDGDTGKILYQNNADEQRHPASLVKKMTLYMLFDSLKKGKIRLNTTFTVSAAATRQIPSKLGLPAGAVVTVDTIIKSLVTKSANDMALVAAEGLGGSLPDFVEKMNRKAKELDMNATHFVNASGVPVRGKSKRGSVERQHTTARDMATLSMALYRDFPEYWNVFKLRAFTFQGSTHHNHNHLMKYFPGMDGIKTGFVNASGFNLSTSAVRYTADGKPVRLFAVFMGGRTRHDRDRQIARLMEAQFQKLGATKVYKMDS